LPNSHGFRLTAPGCASLTMLRADRCATHAGGALGRASAASVNHEEEEG
jgi:hypothetical protein